jgi:hypothetical protein
MKKDVSIVFFSLVLTILIVAGLSCWSPFEPVTNMGKDVITTVDPTVTDLKNGFRKIDSVDIAVQGARSLVSPKNDTSKFMLKSGDFAGLYEAGGFGDDSAVMYAEFQMSSADLATYKTARNGSADNVKFLLWYDTSNNDKTIPGPLTIQVFLCARKYFPNVRNELMTVDDVLPCTTITTSRLNPDSFFVSLGAEMAARLNKAIADSTTIVAYPDTIDTLYGYFKLGIDSVAKTAYKIFGPDTVFRQKTLLIADTLIKSQIDSIIGVRRFVYGDTTILNFTALHYNTNPADTDTTVVADTLPKFIIDSIIGLKAVVHTDTTVVDITTLHCDTISAKFDTSSFVYDTSKKFIGAASVHVLGGGGIVRFARQPVFQISYHQNSTDTAITRKTYVSGYYDINVTEKTSIPGDSLVASWQADRFVEIPINLKPMWDSAKTSDGKDFKIVQDASCLLDSVSSFFEGVAKNDTTRTIVFGLLDHTITDSKAHSISTRDSLLKFSGLASKVVSVSQKQISLPLTMFLQSLSDRGRPETAYLYLFVEPTTRFARVALVNPATIRFTALFSNSHK